METALKETNILKIPVGHLVQEPTTCNSPDRFSHPGFTRKMPKGISFSDYDDSGKLIEIAFADGNRNWVGIGEFFGVVIAEAKDILILYPDGHTESMLIVNVECFREKRTLYWKLIFERDLPF